MVDDDGRTNEQQMLERNIGCFLLECLANTTHAQHRLSFVFLIWTINLSGLEMKISNGQGC